MLGPLLQYQSLQTVLLHTDANIRFRISARMPSIRDVEKLVPVKISSLDISNDSTTIVNDTRYNVCIQRHFPEGTVSLPIALKQNEMGSTCDFDEFGLPFIAGRNGVLPGDVSFLLEPRPDRNRRPTEEDERECRDDLRLHEEALKKQTELESKGITVKDYLKSLGPITGDRLDRAAEEEYRMRRILTESPATLSDTIEHCKIGLLPFDCRRNNTKTPFPCFVQLTITRGGSKQIHRFEYNKKLFEVSKGLNEALFGRRTVPIQVGRFVLNILETIYRLPVDFRLHAKHVRANEPIFAHESFRLLVENSESLDTVTIAFNMPTDAFQTQIIRRAKNLVIENVSDIVMQRLTQIIQNLSNLGVTIKDLESSPERIFNFIQAWLNADRPVGASCCIEVRDEEIVEEILTLVQTQYERANRTNRCVSIQRSNSTRVEVLYVSFTPRPIFFQSQGTLKARIVNV